MIRQPECSRKFHAKNTDPERSCLNVEYCNENVKDVYHELFDEALARYNEKQTRSDRRIDDYYEKIRSGKQESTRSVYFCHIAGHFLWVGTDRLYIS